VYESPRRLRSLLEALDGLDGGASPRRILVARELTKTHEALWRGRLGDAAAWIDGGGAGAAAPGGAPRGEMTIVLDAAPPRPPASAEDAGARVAAAVARGLAPTRVESRHWFWGIPGILQRSPPPSHRTRFPRFLGTGRSSAPRSSPTPGEKSPKGSFRNT